MLLPANWNTWFSPPPSLHVGVHVPHVRLQTLNWRVFNSKNAHTFDMFHTFSNTLLKPSHMPNSFCCSTVLHFPACFLGLDSTYLQSQAAFGWQWHTIAYNGSGQSGALQEDARPLQSLCETWKQSHNLWVRLRCCTWKTSSSLCAIKHVGQQMREAWNLGLLHHLAHSAWNRD